MLDPAARARLERWKLSLLDLSAANRLLDVKDGKTTIPLPAVDPVAIAAALADGAAFTLVSDPEVTDASDASGAGAAGTLRSPLAAPELARRLVAIRRAARAQLADGGVHTLWLGLGLLTWCEAAPDPASGEREVRRAPVALWPVELERTAGGAVQLVEAAGLEPRGNPALGEKLRRDAGVVLPPTGDDLELAALLDAAEAIAAARPGWRLERSAQLGIFAFSKIVMWNDLDARAGELVESPIVAHLARGAGVAFEQPSPAARNAVSAVTAQSVVSAQGVGTRIIKENRTV